MTINPDNNIVPFKPPDDDKPDDDKPDDDKPDDDKPEKEPLLSYAQFRDSQFETLHEIWNYDIPLTHNFMNLVKESVIMPYADIQIPILTAYAFIPSAMATVVPILFCQGKRGSGKSTISMLIGAMRQAPIISAATTFAALRNQFNQLRWAMPEICRGEQNCCLLLDNVNRDTLNNENLYTMLLNGYNRKTDIISISKGNGENMEFRVFGLKVLSSVHPVYTQSKYSELARRCMVIKCKPFEEFTVAEKESLEMDDEFTIASRLEPENYDMTILSLEYKEFWRHEYNLLEYTMLKRKLGGRKKPFKLPKVIDGAKWTISVDLLVTGLVTRVWETLEDGIEALANYWEWSNENVMNDSRATHKVLQSFITAELELIDKANKEFGSEIVPKEINPDKLKKHITWAASKGMLDINPTPSIVADIMADLGWMLDKGTNGNIHWVQSLK